MHRLLIVLRATFLGRLLAVRHRAPLQYFEVLRRLIIDRVALIMDARCLVMASKLILYFMVAQMLDWGGIPGHCSFLALTLEDKL